LADCCAVLADLGCPAQRQDSYSAHRSRRLPQVHFEPAAAPARWRLWSR
jgi:hypothetical protein